MRGQLINLLNTTHERMKFILDFEINFDNIQCLVLKAIKTLSKIKERTAQHQKSQQPEVSKIYSIKKILKDVCLPLFHALKKH